MKIAFWLIPAIIIILALILVIRTWLYPFKDTEMKTGSTVAVKASEKAVERLSGGLKIPTVSNVDYEETDFVPFNQFKEYLRAGYPRIYEQMETGTVNEYGLIFRWPGKNPALKPVLFLSHYDVVPVLEIGDQFPEDEPNALPFQDELNPAAAREGPPLKWDYPPFSGAVANGRLYGRGSLDMKGMLFSLLEAAEELAAQGFQPERDIWLAFGHDEEVSGRQGAVFMAGHFQKLGLRFEAVYDEGGIIASLSPQGRPVALIGIGEKGFLTLNLKVRGLGGHSSMPPARSSLVQAAEIIQRLNEKQMPLRLIPPVADFLDNAGGMLDFKARLAIANQWLLKPLMLKIMAGNPTSNALVRTTTALSMAKGSDAPNVLASVAEVTVNFRLLPGDTVAGVIDHVREVCRDYDVEIEVVSQREPSSLSPVDTMGYQVMEKALARIYPEALVTPYLTIGGTDAYKYQIVSDNIYRFMPVKLTAQEQRTIHNENEYLSLENYGKMISYFKEVMAAY